MMTPLGAYLYVHLTYMHTYKHLITGTIVSNCYILNMLPHYLVKKLQNRFNRCPFTRGRKTRSVTVAMHHRQRREKII